MNPYNRVVKSGILIYSILYSYGFLIAYATGAKQYLAVANLVNTTALTVGYLATFLVLGATYFSDGDIEDEVDRALKFFGEITWLPNFHLASTFVTVLTFGLQGSWVIGILYALMGFAGYVFLLISREA